jgi:hypothetical protein
MRDAHEIALAYLHRFLKTDLTARCRHDQHVQKRSYNIVEAAIASSLKILNGLASPKNDI